MKYLGIDYGTKKIGLAVSDQTGTIAFPYRLLKNEKDSILSISEIIKKEAIEHIVIGYSTNNKGQENKVMEHIHAFKSKLEHTSNTPISFQKEFMTSVFACQSFSGKEKRSARQIKQKPTGEDDVLAAMLILQRFLETKKHTV